ncbi:MAG TPA: TRAP transporter small permease [Geminicoccaceae bacterium]|nr:TRAP transporter small permease [Geminicoccaceae bacterium]
MSAPDAPAAAPPPWRRPAWLRAIRFVESWLTRAALAVAMVGVAMMAGLTCYQVVMRFVVGQPSTWSEVLVRSVMIWTVYLGSAAAFREGAVIAAEVVMRNVGPTLGKAMQIAVGAASFAFLVILVWTGWQMVQRTQLQQLAGLEIPISWLYLSLPVGGTLAALAVLVRTSELLEPGAQMHEAHVEAIE